MPNDGTGTGWDETLPADVDPRKYGAQEIRDLRIALRIRFGIEHETPAVSSAGYRHRKGSARAYYQSGAPTLAPDGNALGANDDGRLYVDSVTKAMKVWDAAAFQAVNVAAGIVPQALIWHLNSSGVDGGNFTAGSWIVRTLNSKPYDVSTIVTAFAANQFTLAAGTYRIDWRSAAQQVGKHQSRLKNVTDATTYIGTSEYSNSSGQFENSWSEGSVELVLGGTKVFQLEHQCQTTCAFRGFGSSCGFSGTSEIFAQVKIQKIA